MFLCLDLLKVIICVMCCVRSRQEVLIEESSTIEGLQAATDGAVELPCDVTPALPGDSMGLVIWYKQGHDAPIYTFDIRDGVTSHWSDPSTMGARATFRADTTPAVLFITKLRPEDSGQYRCRVDFLRSPTKNTRLNLTILIPPERLMILDHAGEEIDGGVLGPYDEGTEVNLTCIAVGGRPPARVSWWKAHALLSNSETRASVSLTLQRADLAAIVTCQAVTDPSITPLSKTLSIDVNYFRDYYTLITIQWSRSRPDRCKAFETSGCKITRLNPFKNSFISIIPPLWVRLQGGARVLVAGRTTDLVCTAVGGRPTPTLSWWKGGTRLNTVDDVTSLDGNMTRSTLSFVPSVDDAGRMVTCKATQPTFPYASHEDGFKLEIQHLPLVKLELGANIDADKVIEGTDVYLDCMVRANPWHTHVYFTHNSSRVRGGLGVVVANQSLVLQSVSRRVAGPYICVARNALGEGSSEPVDLNVKYRPICKTQTTILHAARGEILEIYCEVDSNPVEPVSYQWWFNNTAHSKVELNSQATMANTHGRYLYVVNSSADYGWVQCAGTNAIGRQVTPCLFQILPAEKPSSPKHCAITNITHESLWLECSPGHDGGLRQNFLLQVFDMSSGSLLRNVSSEEAQFVVWGLTGAVGLSVRAYNQKGLSDPFTMTSSLLKHPQRQTANLPVRVELTTVLIITLCVVAAIAAVTTVSAIIFFMKCCNRNDDKNEKSKRKKEDVSNTPLTGTKRCDSIDSLDKNPDIIPIESKINDNYTKSEYATMKPLIQKDKYDRYDDHTRPMYQHGPLHANLSHISNDKVYENWLKYKNSLPINSGLLPMEQMPEMYPIYGTNSPIPMESMSNLEPQSFSHIPVSVNMHNNSAHYIKTSRRNTLPHRKTVFTSQLDSKPTLKTVETNTLQGSGPTYR